MLYDDPMTKDGYGPIAHIMIGAPGSGKSTKAGELAKIFDSVIISTDEIRKDLYGDESIQGEWSQIAVELRRRVRCARAMDRNVILDATHARSKSRRETIKFLEECGFAQIVPVLVHPPLDICLERNRRRLRNVPQRVIIQMWETIEQNKKYIMEEFRI